MAPTAATGAPRTGPAAQLVLLGDHAQRAIDEAARGARAAWLVRDLTTVPSNVKNPGWVADVAERLAHAAGLAVTRLDGPALAAGGFGGLTAVGQGSASEPALVAVPAILTLVFGVATGLPIGFALVTALYLLGALVLVSGLRLGSERDEAETVLATIPTDPYEYCPGLFLTLDATGIVRAAGGRDRQMFLSFLREPLSRAFVEQVHVSDRLAFVQALDELRLGADVVVTDLRLDRPVIGLDQAQFLNVRLDMTAVRADAGAHAPPAQG